MKKFLVFLLSAIAVFSLTSCGNEPAPTEPTSAGGPDKLKIGIMSNTNVTDYEDNRFTEYLEKTANVKLEFEFFPASSDNAIRQLSLMAAGEEKFPDVIWGFTGMSANAISEYGDAGYFLDLTDLVETNAPNYKAAYEKLPVEEQKRIQSRGISESGGFYAMPRHFMSVVDDMQSLMYINKTWLEKLNLEAPTNIDELYTVLKAFKEKDPNGNGVADELPMFGRGNGDSSVINYIMNAFVYYDNRYKFNATDGKVWASFTSEEYRECLKYCNKLVKEGLISDMCFTVSNNSEIMSVTTPADGTPIVGITVGHPDLVFVRTSPLLNDYTALTFLDDATGKGGYNVIFPRALAWGGMITKDCKNPEVAMRFLDTFYLDETCTRGRHGERDVDWYEEEGTSLFGGKAYINLINSDVFFRGNSTWCANGLGIYTNENYLYCDNGINETDKQENRLLGEACRIFEKKNAPKELVTDLIYTARDYEKKTTYNANINGYITEQRNYFILGTKDPNNDKDWQDYLDGLDKLELSDYIDLMQKVYDENKANGTLE